MQTLIVSVVLLGLAVAVSSPTSVLAVVVILEVTSGLRRGVAFVVGWVATIALFAVALALFPALDFQRSQTTPSRAASIAELVIGTALVAGAAVVYRRPLAETPKDPIPEWLTRLVGRHWAVAFAAGAFMLTYSLTIVAALEILKAHVGTVDRIVAFAIYGVTSILTHHGSDRARARRSRTGRRDPDGVPAMADDPLSNDQRGAAHRDRPCDHRQGRVRPRVVGRTHGSGSAREQRLVPPDPPVEPPGERGSIVRFG